MITFEDSDIDYEKLKRDTNNLLFATGTGQTINDALDWMEETRDRDISSFKISSELCVSFMTNIPSLIATGTHTNSDRKTYKLSRGWTQQMINMLPKHSAEQLAQIEEDYKNDSSGNAGRGKGRSNNKGPLRDVNFTKVKNIALMHLEAVYSKMGEDSKYQVANSFYQKFGGPPSVARAQESMYKGSKAAEATAIMNDKFDNFNKLKKYWDVDRLYNFYNHSPTV